MGWIFGEDGLEGRETAPTSTAWRHLSRARDFAPMLAASPAIRRSLRAAASRPQMEIPMFNPEEPPEFETSRWFNTEKPMSLERLQRAAS